MVKTTHENTQKTILKTSKSEPKCRFSEGGSAQVLADSASFQKRGLNNGFQHQNTQAFSNKTGCKRKLKRKNIPEYRLINNYFKSSTQYWKERNRRKQAWKLYSEGFKQTQIAEKLNVSTKTVSHDLRKVSSYYIGQLNKARQYIRDERDAEYMKRIDSMTMAERLSQFKQLGKLMGKRLDFKRKKQSTINVVLEIEEILRVFADQGKPDKPIITVPQRALYTSLKDLRIHFMLRVGDKLLGYRTLTLS